jgi:hypothetical protein
MSEKEREESIRLMEEYRNKLIGNKELCREFLVKAGIYTKEGKLTDPYKHLYLPKN